VYKFQTSQGQTTEAPKASMGEGNGEGCPPPQLIRGLGERHKLPQQGPGRSPSRKQIFRILELEKHT